MGSQVDLKLALAQSAQALTDAQAALATANAALAASGPPIGRTMFSAVNFPTSSATFVDAFAGGVLTVPVGGDGPYLAIFDSNASDGGAGPDLEIGIAINSVTVPDADSVRMRNANINVGSVVATAALVLVAGDEVSGLVRKSAGVGDVELDFRRLSIIQWDLT